MVTLAVFGQWGQFKSERAFYRYAVCHLRAAFPTLPAREQFNRVPRQYRDVIVAFSLYLVDHMQAQRCLYEALDSSGIPTRPLNRSRYKPVPPGRFFQVSTASQSLSSARPWLERVWGRNGRSSQWCKSSKVVNYGPP